MTTQFTWLTATGLVVASLFWVFVHGHAEDGDDITGAISAGIALVVVLMVA